VASTYTYAPNELPAQYKPYGYEWLHARLLTNGRTNPQIYDDPSSPGSTIVRVDDDNISKNQLKFEMQPSSGQLTCNYTTLNVPPLTTKTVAITGPAGTLVKVRFDGIGFVSETEFTIPGNNNYEFMFGPCTGALRVVSPQMFDFYVEDGSCSPVAVLVTFK
jgi:hypothetical protein